MQQGTKQVAQIEVVGRWPKEFGKREAVQVAEETLSLLGRLRNGVSLSVSLVSEAEIQRLNRDYRGQNKITDVLSFGMLEGGGFPGSNMVGSEDLGDIIICLKRVKKQSEEIDRPLATELALMVAHGTLHLLGFDHCEAEEEKEMFALQQEVLMRLSYL